VAAPLGSPRCWLISHFHLNDVFSASWKSDGRRHTRMPSGRYTGTRQPPTRSDLHGGRKVDGNSRMSGVRLRSCTDHTRYVIPVLSHGQVCVYGRLQATAWVRSTPRVRYSIQWVPGRACMHAGRATADRLDWCPVDSTRQTSPSPHGTRALELHTSLGSTGGRYTHTAGQGRVKGLGVWHILRVVAAVCSDRRARRDATAGHQVSAEPRAVMCVKV